MTSTVVTTRVNPDPDRGEFRDGPDAGMAPGAYLPFGAGEEGGLDMYHSDFAMRYLAEQRSSELIAEAERLNQLHDARRRWWRRYLRSFLARLGRPTATPRSGPTVIDLRELAAGTEETTAAPDISLHPSS